LVIIFTKMQKQYFLTANIILYCEKWKETVRFYKNTLYLEVIFSSDWFIEFSLNDKSRLSIADQKRTSIKSVNPKGITIALQVKNIDMVWNDFFEKDLNPTQIKNHPWNAKVFYIFDPEGHRIEIWQTL